MHNLFYFDIEYPKNDVSIPNYAHTYRTINGTPPPPPPIIPLILSSAMYFVLIRPTYHNIHIAGIGEDSYRDVHHKGCHTQNRRLSQWLHLAKNY